MAIKLLPDLETQQRIANATEQIAGKLGGSTFSDFYKSKLDEMIAFMGFIYIDGGMFTTTPTISVSGGNFVGFEPQGIIEGGNFI